MAIAETARRYLDSKGGAYRLLPHRRAVSVVEAAREHGVAPEEVAASLLLEDSAGSLLLIFPASVHPDIDALNHRLGRSLKMAPQGHIQALFGDCEVDALPPLGDAYGLKALLDETLTRAGTLHFEAGSHEELVMMARDDFLSLQVGAGRIAGVAAPPGSDASPVARAQIRARIEGISELPAMPEMARRLLVLRSNPYADVDDLAHVVEMDPSLSAQIIRYARSPFFSFRGKVTSVQSAISRVLGYEPVMNIALGIAAGRPFRNPPDGPLGLDAFWREALYTAALSQSLINAMPYEMRPKPGLAYLGGLLHNFGFVLLGHLFQEEFLRLNRTVAANPEVPVTELERRIVDVTHMELGVWLMEAWRMPREVVTAIAEHHNPDYDDVHAAYVNLVLIASRLLKRHGIGDAESEELPEAVMERLGMHEGHVESVVENVLAGADELDKMAHQMSA